MLYILLFATYADNASPDIAQRSACSRVHLSTFDLSDKSHQCRVVKAKYYQLRNRGKDPQNHLLGAAKKPLTVVQG